MERDRRPLSWPAATAPGGPGAPPAGTTTGREELADAGRRPARPEVGWTPAVPESAARGQKSPSRTPEGEARPRHGREMEDRCAFRRSGPLVSAKAEIAKGERNKARSEKRSRERIFLSLPLKGGGRRARRGVWGSRAIVNDPHLARQKIGSPPSPFQGEGKGPQFEIRMRRERSPAHTATECRAGPSCR